MDGIDRIEVFTATKASERRELGQVVTRWLAEFRSSGGMLVDRVVTQSSDNEFHCLSITLFCKGGDGKVRNTDPPPRPERRR